MVLDVSRGACEGDEILVAVLAFAAGDACKEVVRVRGLCAGLRPIVIGKANEHQGWKSKGLAISIGNVAPTALIAMQGDKLLTSVTTIKRMLNQFQHCRSHAGIWSEVTW